MSSFDTAKPAKGTIWWGLALTVATMALLYYTVKVLLILLSAGLAAFFLCRVSRFMSGKLNLSRLPCTLLLLLFLLVAFGFIGLMAGPQLWEQARELWEILPHSMQQLRAYTADYPSLEAIRKYLSDSGFEPKLTDYLGGAKVVFDGLLGLFSAALLFLASTLYLALQPKNYSNGFKKILDKLLSKPRSNRIWVHSQDKLWGFLLGQLQMMLIIATLTTIGLYVIGVPAPFALGTIAGIMAFIPVLGPVLSVVPAVMTALTKSPSTALWVLGLFACVQLAEGNFILPVIQKKASRLPPVVTLAFQAVFGTLWGPLGIFLAAPMAIVSIILGQEWLGELEEPRDQ